MRANIKTIINNTSITVKITQSIILLLMTFGVSACSTYPSKFKCGDARGLGCTMLREVDRQIDSGKIEEAYKDKKKCRGSNCSSEGAASFTLKNTEKAKSHKSKKSLNKNQLSAEDDNNLYF